MIAEITGEISNIEPDAVIVSVGGIGYRVYTTPETSSEAKRVGGPIHLYTYLHVREQAQDLYGFSTREETDFFELLIGISGIGPKSALAILSLGPVASLKAATQAGDVSYLTRVSGVGKKHAEKIVLELRDRLGAHIEHNGRREDVDALDALCTLGYSVAEAREALRDLPPEIERSEDRVKEALKRLAK